MFFSTRERVPASRGFAAGTAIYGRQIDGRGGFALHDGRRLICGGFGRRGFVPFLGDSGAIRRGFGRRGLWQRRRRGLLMTCVVIMRDDGWRLWPGPKSVSRTGANDRDPRNSRRDPGRRNTRLGFGLRQRLPAVDLSSNDRRDAPDQRLHGLVPVRKSVDPVARDQFVAEGFARRRILDPDGHDGQFTLAGQRDFLLDLVGTVGIGGKDEPMALAFSIASTMASP